MIRAVFVAAVLIASPALAQTKPVTVKPYARADGTIVQGHVRTAPNRTVLDNYSTKPNYNPYTGQQGTVDPYKPRPLPATKPLPGVKPVPKIRF